MHRAKPLPSLLVQRYHGWKATTYTENKSWYKRLADEGQRPKTMIISCCDSRVHVTSLFGADQGSSSFTATSPTWSRPTNPTATSTAPRRRWNMP